MQVYVTEKHRTFHPELVFVDASNLIILMFLLDYFNYSFN